MDTEVFSDWFNKFADLVKERPLLLLLDGHLTHISIPVISRALEENIIIMKFPPHVTDVLQPLDVSCFGPLKRKWEQLLHERVNIFGPKHQLTKPDFVNQLCKVWTSGMNEENVKHGFSTTGKLNYGNFSYFSNHIVVKVCRLANTFVQFQEFSQWIGTNTRRKGWTKGSSRNTKCGRRRERN